MDEAQDGDGFTLSEEERRRIRESVRYENRVREALKEPDKPKKGSLWDALNSGFGLLVLTTVVSSILVPIFQKRSERAEWVRKTQAENGAFKLGRMRECYKEFQLMASAIPQADYLYRRVRSSSSRSKTELEAFDQKISDLEPKRIERFANARALLAYSPDEARLTRLLLEYNNHSREALELLHNYVGLRKILAGDPTPEEAGRIERRLENLIDVIGRNGPADEARDRLQSALIGAIHKEEARYENFDASVGSAGG